MGCTIIDINPGVGLWSSKLHHVLKPKCHILVEPSESLYLPYLKSLLDAPGSRYLLRNWNDEQLWAASSYVSEGLISKPKSVIKNDARNDSLLIIANLSHGLSKSKKTGAVHSRIVEYVNQIKFQRDLQASGPARMLVWVNDSDKNALLPRQVYERKRLSVEIEMTCHVEEIVGGSASKISNRREDFLDIESSKRVAKKMEQQNIQVPNHRRDDIQGNVQKELMNHTGANTLAAIKKHVGVVNIHRNWHTDLIKMEQASRAAKSRQLIKDSSDPFSARIESKSEGEEIVEGSKQRRKLLQLRTTFRAQNKYRNNLDLLIQKQSDVDRLESDIQDLKLNELQIHRKSNELKQLKEMLKLHVEKAGKAVREGFYYSIDNRKSFSQNPPLFLWDRRSAEPLIAQDNEFWNPKLLALLDFQPRSPNNFPVASMRADSFKLIMAALFMNNSATLHCLNSLAPGAAEAIAPNVPALQDPRKGGRTDLLDLRVRCFTPEMIYGIAQAWENWPFKPAMAEMMVMYYSSKGTKGVL